MRFGVVRSRQDGQVPLAFIGNPNPISLLVFDSIRSDLGLVTLIVRCEKMKAGSD